MARFERVTARLQAALRASRRRSFERDGGPGPVVRWCYAHPWVVTLIVAVLLGGVLAVTFGVPPFSPLVLVLVLVAPVPLWLRADKRVYDEWRADR